MKKFLSLLVLLVAFTSCEEEIQFNNPTVQGLIENEMWRGTDIKAVRGTDNSLRIEAVNGFETLILTTSSLTPGTYVLGENEANKAAFVMSADGIEMAYQTGTGMGSGQIIISDRIDETNPQQGFISGSFKFIAEDGQGNTVSFQNGFFYKVPMTPVTGIPTPTPTP